MSFTWNANIPGPTDPFSQSQGEIQTNFNTLDSVFNIDHIPYSNGGSTQGQHKQITFNAPLAPAAPAGTVGLGYTKTVSARSELHYRNATKESQITFSGLTTASGEGGMPGGLQIRTGTVNSFQADNVNHAVSYSTQFPTATIVVMTTASNSDYTHPVQTSGTGATSFNAKCNNGGTVNFTYVAIGY